MRHFAVLLSAVAFLAPVHAAESPNWTQFGGPTGDFRVAAKLPDSFESVKVLWRVPIGLGESSVVGDGTRLFTMFGTSDADDRTKGTEHVVALDPKDGKPIWEHKYAVSGLPKGDTPVKGGRCGPQSTSCVSGGRVFAIGYTGRVSALDAATGKVLWEKELTTDFGGEAPEFGFASSPVMLDKLLLIPAGGKKTSLVAVDPADGSEKWRTVADRASYCTPQIVTVCGEKQIVHMTRNKLNGFSPADGKQLWSFTLALEGLTNVPSPLVLSGDRIVISGQGVKGMRMLKVTKTGDTFTVKEVWKTDPQFFYCNWGVIGDVLYGYGGSAFVAVNLADGEVVWSDKAQKEANWLSFDGTPLVLRGDGQLARCKFTDSGVEVLAKLAATTVRTWTPPSVIGDRVYVRNTTELVAVSLGVK
jgi:outer membrane protein assembly factor BamB